MAGKLTHFEMAKSVLEEADKPLTIDEICKRIITRYDLSQKENFAYNRLYNTLYQSLRWDNAEKLLATTNRPLTFWLKSRELPSNLNLENVEEEALEEQAQKIQQIEEKGNFKERDLHPLLVSFAAQQWGLICKTIFHERTQGKSAGGINRWNHPDIVGVNFPQLENETTHFLTKLSRNLYQMYSFELKIAVNSSNLKECYFQAVSNSTWANEGYLVVFENLDGEVLEELERLNQSFGIGVIQLEKDPWESKIIYPAHKRALDIQTLNMLVRKNPDFKKFVAEITEKISATLQRHDSKIESDEILKGESLENYIQKMHIDK